MSAEYSVVRIRKAAKETFTLEQERMLTDYADLLERIKADERMQVDPTTKPADSGRVEAHRLLKDALFACVAEGLDQAGYGGVAYKGGGAKIVFSIERPAAALAAQGQGDGGAK